MEDIAPELLARIEQEFEERFKADSLLAELAAKLEARAASHTQAYEYAGRVGEILTDAYQHHIASSSLPDGRLWYNIADRVITPTMKRNYDLIAKYVTAVQTDLNQAAGIGIKALPPDMDVEEKIQGIVNRVSSEKLYDDVRWILKEPVKTFGRNVVDTSIKANAEFQGRSGLTPKIIRKTSGSCCKWCTSLAGTYTYPDVPKDVYRRHDNCRCTVEYVKGKTRTNVYTKELHSDVESDKIEYRKNIQIEPDKDKRKTEYRSYVGRYNLSYDESKALIDYISSESYIVNDKLRKGLNLTTEELELCKNLDSALGKMPKYNGNLSRSVLFYSDEEINEFIKEFQIDSEIAFKEYISATQGKELYNPDGQVQIYIDNAKSGRDISMLNTREQEVIYERESRFKVLNRVYRKDEKKWYILLEEL